MTFTGATRRYALRHEVGLSSSPMVGNALVGQFGSREFSGSGPTRFPRVKALVGQVVCPCSGWGRRLLVLRLDIALVSFFFPEHPSILGTRRKTQGASRRSCTILSSRCDFLGIRHTVRHYSSSSRWRAPKFDTAYKDHHLFRNVSLEIYFCLICFRLLSRA